MQLARQGVRCRVLTYRAAVPGLSRRLTHYAWLRYHLRWLASPREYDGIPVSHIFYPQTWQRQEDVLGGIGEALVRFIEAHPEYLDTDVVYAHWLWTGGAAALALRERFGWPVAAIARGSEMHHWQTAHRHCRGHVERVLQDADLVLANCEGLRRSAEAIVPGAAAYTRVVYNGCDAQAFRPAADRAAARRALGLPLGGRMLLCCASIIDRKGMAELAEAWSLFSPRCPGWRLVVVGRPVQRELVCRLRRAGPGRVAVMGEVPAARVGAYMQAADAYVQPSRLEGLANATMEAMAVGLPVIATDTGGQREAIRDGENGWLVPPADAKALARAMHLLATDVEQAQRFGMAARQTIEAKFDPSVQAGYLSALLRGLCRPEAITPPELRGGAPTLRRDPPRQSGPPPSPQTPPPPAVPPSR